MAILKEVGQYRLESYAAHSKEEFRLLDSKNREKVIAIEVVPSVKSMDEEEFCVFCEAIYSIET
jgi:hypothetical protein